MRIIKILFASIILPVFLFAQKEDFSKAVDYCNCKLTSAYLKKYTSSMSNDNAEKKSFEKIKDKFDNCEIGNSLTYLTLSNLLDNNNFKSSNADFSKPISEIKNNYTDGLTKDDAINKIIKGIFDNNSIQGVINKFISKDEMKKSLTENISIYFENKFKQNDNVNLSTEKSATNAEPTQLNDQVRGEIDNRIANLKTDSWSFNYLSLVLIIIAITIVYIIIMANMKNRLRKTHKILEKQIVEINTLKSMVETNGGVGTGRANLNFKTEWQSKLEQKVAKIEIDFNKLDNDFLLFKSDTTRQSYVGSNSSGYSKNEQQTKTEILYASIPSKDGTFSENAISSTLNPTASFYKLTIADSTGQKASLEFLGNDERAVKDATNAPDRILRPACKINNALNQNAKRINTLVPGTVIKKNGKWEIDILAEIEYE